MKLKEFNILDTKSIKFIATGIFHSKEINTEVNFEAEFIYSHKTPITPERKYIYISMEQYYLNKFKDLGIKDRVLDDIKSDFEEFINQKFNLK